jgi:hypothetical protein
MARWQLDLRNGFRLAIPLQSVTSATWETLRALAPLMHFS